jgi:hypothetical protein
VLKDYWNIAQIMQKNNSNFEYFSSRKLVNIISNKIVGKR